MKGSAQLKYCVSLGKGLSFQQDLQMVDFKWEEVVCVATDVQNGAKLLPDVLKGTGETSK